MALNEQAPSEVGSLWVADYPYMKTTFPARFGDKLMFIKETEETLSDARYSFLSGIFWNLKTNELRWLRFHYDDIKRLR